MEIFSLAKNFMSKETALKKLETTIDELPPRERFGVLSNLCNRWGQVTVILQVYYLVS